MTVLYVSDLDGTLLNDKQELSIETVETINGLIEQGLNFTIATARSIESARELIKGLNLQLPIILINGVFIYDMQKFRNIQCNYLSRECAAEIVETYLQSKLNPLLYTTNLSGESRIYYRGIFNKSEENYIGNRLSKGDTRFRIVQDYDNCINENIITVNAIDTPEHLEQSHKKFLYNPDCVSHFGPDIYTPGFNWLEIANQQATKKKAVLYLKNQFEFQKIVCFGDNLNDYPMFEAADEKYAVRNAHEVIINAADKIIDSNNDNGVARYLRTAVWGDSN